MSFYRKGWMVEEDICPDDEMDVLVRWALRDSVADEEPPPEVWHQIGARLGQPEAQSHLRRKRFPLAQLSRLVLPSVLGLVALLVALVLSPAQGVVIVLLYWYIQSLLARPWLVEHTIIPTGGQEWFDWQAEAKPSVHKRSIIPSRDYVMSLGLHCV